MIDDERPTFSNVGPDPEPLDALIGFLADHGELHASLDSAAHILIEGRLRPTLTIESRRRSRQSTWPRT
jgi:hypothetical protein